MFWKWSLRKEESTTPRLSSFVLMLLIRTLVTVEYCPKNKREDLRAAFLGAIAAETFMIGGAIGSERPDLIPTIFKQCCAEPDDAIKQVRGFLDEVLNTHDLRLETLPYRSTKYVAETLKKRRPSHRLGDWDQQLYKAMLIGSFLPGCVLGCEQTQLFWDMLQKDEDKVIREGSLSLCATAMSTLYDVVLSDETKRVLKALAVGGLETPVGKLVTLYKEIAAAILADYERKHGPIPVLWKQ